MVGLAGRVDDRKNRWYFKAAVARHRSKNAWDGCTAQNRLACKGPLLEGRAGFCLELYFVLGNNKNHDILRKCPGAQERVWLLSS